MNDNTAANHLPADGAPSAPRPLSLSDRVRSLRLADRTSRPGTRQPWLPWALCCVLGLLSAVLGIRNLQREPAPDAAKPSTPNYGDAARAIPKDGLVLESKGYIIPIRLIQVSPLIGGKVVDLKIEEGQKVAKGQVLAQLEKDEFQSDQDHTVAAVESARRRHAELRLYRDKEIDQAAAELEEAKAQREQLQLDYLRNVELRSRQAGAQRDFELSRSAFMAMDNRVKRLDLACQLMIKGMRDEKIAAAKAEWELAKADLAKAVWRLENCTIIAPINGIILSKKAEKHNRVNPAAYSNGLSASLCEMADLTELEVDLAIAERDIAKITKLQHCQVRAEAYPDRIYKGYVSRIMPQADRAKGAVPVRVLVLGISREEEGKYLRPEMGAIVTFLNKTIDPKLVRPEHMK
jgi:multidrug resistance efflux pump